MTKLFFSLLLICTVCGCKHQHRQVRYILDLSKQQLELQRGDSIWWSIGELIIDSGNNRFFADDSGAVMKVRGGHFIHNDTVIGLLHLKPVVIIINKDTQRRYFGDTLRYTTDYGIEDDQVRYMSDSDMHLFQKNYEKVIKEAIKKSK